MNEPNMIPSDLDQPDIDDMKVPFDRALAKLPPQAQEFVQSLSSELVHMGGHNVLIKLAIVQATLRFWEECVQVQSN